MSDEATEKPLSVAEAAEYLRLGHEATLQLFEQGDIPAVKLNRKHFIVLPSVLREFVAEQGRKQAEERQKQRAPQPGTPAGTLRAAAMPRTRRKASDGKPDLSKYEERRRG